MLIVLCVASKKETLYEDNKVREKMGHKFLRLDWDAWECQIFMADKETRNDKESLATINATAEAGINFFDTGDYYGMGHNELLLREAMRGRRDKFFISVKFGALRGTNGEFSGLICVQLP